MPTETFTASTGPDRSSFPFIPSTGERTLVSDAVDDLVVYVLPDTTMPLHVLVGLEDGYVVLTLCTSDRQTIAICRETSYTLYDLEGRMRGFVDWNKEGLDILRSTLLGNDPQPWYDLYVDTSVCVPYLYPSMSSLSINGTHITDMIINIVTDNTITIGEDKSLNLYRVTPDSEQPITRIVFTNTADGGTYTVDGIDGHVWIKSDAECDLRVVTGDVITLTEVSNDSI